MRDPQAELEADMAYAPEPTPEDDSIKASFARLIASGRTLALAELDWAKAKASMVGGIVARGIALGIAAVIILLLGIMALVAAAVIALAPLVGWLAATLIVAGILILIALLLGLCAKRTFAQLASPGSGE